MEGFSEQEESLGEGRCSVELDWIKGIGWGVKAC
jgi:hypothetical protein